MADAAYADFLASKRATVHPSGPVIAAERIHPAAFGFQRDIIRWLVRLGRGAAFADTGLGKTLIQLEWARIISETTGGRVLILAPLAVARQTVGEGERFGIPVTHARAQADAAPGITITNYEMLHAFDPQAFAGVVLDESSILKNLDGKTRTALIRSFSSTPYRLCCTATPAPNDLAELGNHAEFLGVATHAEMRARFFVNDGTQSQSWRLKGHARQAFYQWLSTWAMSLRRPSDLGYPDDGYGLPPLTIERVLVQTDYVPDGQLFPTTLRGITERASVRRDTLIERVEAAARIINADDSEPWVVWVGLNDEGTELAARVPDAVVVEGSMTADEKADALEAFADGDIRVLVTKTGIAGMGLNWQHCARMAFVGLSDSYEAYYQAIRRCWRYGQRREVKAYVVLTEPEEAIYVNVKRKQAEADKMAADLVAHVAAYGRAELTGQGFREQGIHGEQTRLPSWWREAV